MLALIAALFLCLLLHLSVLALVGTSLGITLRELSYGYGPVIARWGRVQLKVFPVGGAVRFKDTRVEDLESWEREGTFDGKPAVVQLVVMLSGSTALLALAFAITPSEAFPAFKDGFGQVISGAFSPLTRAQGLLADASTAISQLSFFSLLALVAVKMASFNLLPLPSLNGGALIALIANKIGVAAIWRPSYTQALLFAYMALAFSWLLAWIVYLF